MTTNDTSETNPDDPAKGGKSTTKKSKSKIKHVLPHKKAKEKPKHIKSDPIHLFEESSKILRDYFLFAAEKLEIELPKNGKHHEHSDMKNSKPKLWNI